MSDDLNQDPTIRALEEQLAQAKAKAQADAKIKALHDEIAALQGSGATGPAPTVQYTGPVDPVVAPTVQHTGPVTPVAAQPQYTAPATGAPVVSAGPPPKGNGGLIATLILLIALFAALSVAAFFALRGDIALPGGEAAASGGGGLATELLLVPASTGPNGFYETDLPTIGEPLVTAVASELPETTANVELIAATGDAPEIYGLSWIGCPISSELPALFESAPEASTVWAGALTADPTLAWAGTLDAETYDAFADNLSFGHLLADTRVTYNGYAAGSVFPSQAVLQKGTLVAFDRFGVPRVNCANGVPLTAPELAEGETTFSGQAWADFSADAIATIAPAGAQQSAFSVLPVGPSNVETAVSVTAWACLEADPCPDASSAVKFPDALAAPASSPSTPAECGTAFPENDADRGQLVRVVNATGGDIFLFSAEGSPCTTFFILGDQNGKSVRPTSWEGARWLWTDSSASNVIAELTVGTEPQLFVIQ